MAAQNVTPVGTNRKPSVFDRIKGTLWCMHPLPGGMYTVAVATFGVLASLARHRVPGLLDMLLISAGTFGTQAAIGATNDFCDLALDTASGRNKPLVRGLIRPRTALAASVAGTTLALFCGIALGWLPLVLLLSIESLGIAYDVHFKSTPVSGLLYALYFPLNPLLAWSVFGHWQPFLPWLLPLGAALGIAINFSNSLADLEEDTRMGVRGLPHLFRQRTGRAVAWGIPLVCVLVIWLLDVGQWVPARFSSLLVASVCCVASTVAAATLVTLRPAQQTLRTAFLIQAAGIVLMAGGWIASVAF